MHSNFNDLKDENMNTFIEKMMELGAMEDRSCSKTERELVIKDAKELYNKHLAELKLLCIGDVSQQRELLKAYNIHLFTEYSNADYTDHDVDDFLKAFNCG